MSKTIVVQGGPDEVWKLVAISRATLARVTTKEASTQTDHDGHEVCSKKKLIVASMS